MANTKAVGRTKKSATTKTSKKEAVSEVVTEKSFENHNSNVSVLTKTVGPKVTIQSEKLESPMLYSGQNIHKHRILKSVFMVVMGIIILMTFFLSLKTYNTVNELYQLFTY